MPETEIDVALATLQTRLAAAWQPRPVMSSAAWCEEKLMLPPSVSATPGRFDLYEYAYSRGVLDAVDDDEVEEIVLMFATQVGKTTILQAILASCAALAPVPAMLGTPDKDALMELRDKFYAICEETAALRDQIPPLRLRNDRWIDVGNVRCHLAYSYNTQRMSGKSCALVLATELDRWRQTKTHGDPSKLIAQRVKAFFRSKIVYESSPSDESSRIAAKYLQSDRRRYLVPCPKCNYFQELRFFPVSRGSLAGRGGVAGLKDRKGNWLPADQARQQAHYICEQGCKIVSEQKTEMVAAGQWAPRGQRVGKSGKLAGQPQRPPRIAGFHLNSLYSARVSFGRIAAEYLDCRDQAEQLRVFWNDWLSKVWRRKAKAPKWQELWRRLRGNHHPGIVPPWVLFLTAGSDVGPGYVRWVVRGWGEGGTSALVDWGTTHQRTGARLSHLEALAESVLQREFPLTAANPLAHTKLGVQLLALDCGYKPHLVHEFHRGLAAGGQQARVRQVAGLEKIVSGEPWRSKVLERNARTGQPYPGGQTRWEINRALFNADLHDRWRQSLDEPGAWWLTAATLGQCELYLRELVNEGPVKTRNKAGREVTVWQKLDSAVGNHFFDCEIYASAAADMIVGGDWRDLAARFSVAARAEPTNPRGDVGAREFSPADDFSAR